MDPVNGRIRVWRRDRCRYNNENVLERDPWGGQSVMIWGAMALNHLLGPVCDLSEHRPRTRKWCDRPTIHYASLAPHVVPFFERYLNFLYQQDNARPHTARVTLDFLRQNNVNLMPHPALSPDLNPIEHLLDMVQRQLN